VFVTGTDTGVGKTLVAAALAGGLARRGLRTAGMKPVATGCARTSAGLRSDDALRLARHASVAVDYEWINPYAFEPAIAPHIAAAEAGVQIDLARVAGAFGHLSQRADRIVVEGVGGWRVPLNAREDVADLARLLGLPILLVVGIRLGCISHARLTVSAITSTGLPFAGWVASCIDAHMDRLQENLLTLEALLPAPRLGTLPFFAEPSVEQASEQLDRALAVVA
jgi:dethiobiotin synthetase